MTLHITKEEWDEFTDDVKEIRNMLGGDKYREGFVIKTSYRLLRLELVTTVIIAFTIGLVLGDIESLIKIFS